MSRTCPILLLVLAGCAPVAPPPQPGVEPQPVSAAGLDNVFRVTDGIYSGNSPDGEAGFRSLKELGVRTVVSVDGAAPDVATAKRFGLRYVHLPIGYDGISGPRQVEIAKALRDLPRPIYVHCHHGKHRGPAATMAAVRCLDGNCSAAAAVQFLKTAGTDPRYAGLYAAVERQPPTLDAGRLDHPETAAVPDLTMRMVEIDEMWDKIKKKPTASDALLLVEHYRELERTTRTQGEDFRRLLDDALRGAEQLEKVVREGRDAGPFVAKSTAACSACHARFRDRR